MERSKLHTNPALCVNSGGVAMERSKLHTNLALCVN